MSKNESHFQFSIINLNNKNLFLIVYVQIHRSITYNFVIYVANHIISRSENRISHIWLIYVQLSRFSLSFKFFPRT